MNARNNLRNSFLLLLSLLAWGCSTPSAPTETPVAKSTAEAKPKVVLMDTLVHQSVGYDNLQQNVLPDGRLEVAANLKNLLARRIQVETQCVFLDAQGMSVGDETP